MTFNQTLRSLKYTSDGKRKFCPEKKKRMWQRRYQQSPDSIVAVSFLPTQDTQTNRIKSSDLLNVLSSLLQITFIFVAPVGFCYLVYNLHFLEPTPLIRTLGPWGSVINISKRQLLRSLLYFKPKLSQLSLYKRQLLN